jgi:RHS repeat-associated protein
MLYQRVLNFPILTKLILSFGPMEYDEETGLYYFRARYYDSTIGRSISEKPIVAVP